MRAYTGLEPAAPLPEPEGISRREWVSSNIGSMRLLLDPVLERAGQGLGPLRPAVQIGMGLILDRRGRSRARLSGPARARAIRACPARRSRRGPPAAAAVRAAEPRAGRPGVRRRGAGVHDLGGAPRGHARGAVLRCALAPCATLPVSSASCFAAPSCASRTPRKLRMPSLEELRRIGSAAAARRPDLDRHQRQPSARRSTASRR